MKLFILLPITFLTLSACGQTTKDTVTIFRKLSLAICNCTFSNMKDNKPSGTLDSCHKVMVLKYTDSLKQIGFDPNMEVGFWKLYNEVDRKLYLHCPDLTKLVQKEYDGGKLKFSGEVISQKKLPSGLYEVILTEVASNEIKTFLAKSPVDENLINKYQPGYVLTLEYEIVNNKQTNKDEYYLKVDGNFSIMGVTKSSTKE